MQTHFQLLIPLLVRFLAEQLLSIAVRHLVEK